MRYIITLAVGLGSYLLFLITTIYGIAFTLGASLPHPFALPSVPALPTLLIDLGLSALFGVQHSVMARSSWKQRWTTIIPSNLERSLYVLISSLSLLALFWFWRPVPSVIWQIANPLLRYSVNGVCLIGWAVVVLSTFQINHFELFGLQQTWRATHHQPQSTPRFRVPLLYRFVRHPMMGGFLIVFWATPLMSVDRLLYAGAMTVYILIGVSFEERALLREFGKTYAAYQAATPQLLPFLRKRGSLRALKEAIVDA